MHAVLLTFRSSADLADLSALFAEYAHALIPIDGLLATTWLKDGEVLGGFHVFASREVAESYLASAMLAELVAHCAFSDIHLRHFAVLEEFTFVTQASLFTRA